MTPQTNQNQRRPRVIVEIGMEITDQQLRRIKGYLEKALHVPYYIEPSPDPPYRTLEELEADCVGK